MADLSTITVDNVLYNIKDAIARSILGGKQATLVSGQNIKTINNQSLLGSGNITIQGGGGGGGTASDIIYNNLISGLTATNVQSAIDELNEEKQANTPTITIASSQVVSDSPVKIQLTQEQNAIMDDDAYPQVEFNLLSLGFGIITVTKQYLNDVYCGVATAPYGDGVGMLWLETFAYVYNTDSRIMIASIDNLATLSDIPDADGILYDNEESGLTASNVQSAIDELASMSSGGEPPLYVTYNSTTFEVIKQAYDKGRQIILTGTVTSEGNRYTVYMPMVKFQEAISITSLPASFTFKGTAEGNFMTTGHFDTAAVVNDSDTWTFAALTTVQSVNGQTGDVTIESGGGEPPLYAKYGTTTFADIKEAYDKGRAVMLYGYTTSFSFVDAIPLVRYSEGSPPFVITKSFIFQGVSQGWMTTDYSYVTATITDAGSWTNTSIKLVKTVNGQSGAVVLEADDIDYNNGDSGLESVEVQTAIDEIVENMNTISERVTEVESYVPTKYVSWEPTGTYTLENNNEYYLYLVSSLRFNYTINNFSAWVKMTTAASGDISITFPSSTKYIPEVPTFGNNETWLIGIEDDIVIAQKAVDA